jgi:putative ABC transport system permease protein
MVSIGESASSVVQSQFEGLGTNVLVVIPAAKRTRGVRSGNYLTLTAKDSRAIAENCESVLAVSPLVGTGGQVVYANTNWQPKEILGVGPDFLTVRNWPLRHGGFFTERDIISANKVCVIGQTLVNKLFQTTNPIGATIRLNNIPLRVVGILEKKGANLVGQDQDDIVLLPYSTVRKRIHGSNFDNVHALLISAKSIDEMSKAENEIHQLLSERHDVPPGESADFDVQNTTEIANVLSIITGIMTALLSSIAGISLLVGGVGIMNIMLVSVTERTREIGIRMAVGATSGEILLQFLVESIILSSFGGLIGLLLGIGASAGVTSFINSITTGTQWPVVISFPAAGIAIGFAALVGMFFGFYPAWQASRLDPIEALRYE